MAPLDQPLTGREYDLSSTESGSDEPYLDYNDIVWFNFYLKPSGTAYDEATEHLHKILPVKGHERPLKRAIKHLLVNLARLAKQYPDSVIAYSRCNEDWLYDPKRNPYAISRKIFNVIDAMSDASYLESKRGYLNRETGKSKTSRMWPTQKLVDAILIPFGLVDAPFEYHEDESQTFVWVRITENEKGKKKKKRAPKYHAPSNERSDQTNGILKDYNDLLQDSDICLPGFHRYGLNRGGYQRVYSVYNSWTLDIGGRFYGPWWQHVRSALRKYILINGNPTVELDYKSQHLYLLYGQYAGVHYSSLYDDGDPYDNIYDAEENIYPTDLIKPFVLTAINAPSCNKAWRALKEKFNDIYYSQKSTWEEKQKALELRSYVYRYKDYQKVLADFLTKHYLLEPYLNTGLGSELQFLDSQVAEYVLRETTQRNIPTLSVHDSFIVEEQYTEMLETVMTEAYTNTGLYLSLPPIK